MAWPSVARRSPAMTMPSAKRRATTVVPWRNSVRPPAVPDGAAPPATVGCRHLQPADQSGEVGAGILGGRKERQGHRGYSPPFWT